VSDIDQPGHQPSRRCYLKGCREADCIEAARAYARNYFRDHYAKDEELQVEARGESADLNCACGGLLAEDDDGRVYCLRCESVAVSA
jgi:hypothetical protein